MSRVETSRVVGSRRDPGTIAVSDVRADFELRPLPETPAESLLEDPRVTLYCLDLEASSAVFVRTRASVAELSRAPFFFMEQRRTADSVYHLPFADFLRLSERLEPPAKARLLHLYSVGRSGSTLLHHAFNLVDSTICLSEPDVFFQLARQSKIGRLSSDRMSELARASLAFLWQECGGPGETLVIKHRGKGIWGQAEFAAAHPAARSVFLYRNAIDTVQSFDRVAGYPASRKWLGAAPPLLRWLLWRRRGSFATSSLEMYSNHLVSGTPEDVIRLCGSAGEYLLDWISKVDSYLEMSARDPASLALRYEDLIEDPASVLATLFSACGLETPGPERIATVFARDSQANTRLRRSEDGGRRLPRVMVERIHQVLAQRTRIGESAPRLPGTVEIEPRPVVEGRSA